MSLVAQLWPTMAVLSMAPRVSSRPPVSPVQVPAQAWNPVQPAGVNTTGRRPVYAAKPSYIWRAYSSGYRLCISASVMPLPQRRSGWSRTWYAPSCLKKSAPWSTNFFRCSNQGWSGRVTRSLCLASLKCASASAPGWKKGSAPARCWP